MRPQSCERIRQELEQMDTERDMENFVRDYGTGNAIPDPPQFVNYANPDAVPPSSQRPSTRPAKFTRIVQRQGPPAAQFNAEAEDPQPQPEPEPVNITGVGAGGGHHRPESVSNPQQEQQTGRARSHSRASNRQSFILPNEQANGHAANGVTPPYGGPPGAMRPADPQAEPINPTATTMLKVGDRAYEVDLTKDPQARGSSAQNGSTIGSSRVGQNDDPLAIQMEQLRNTAGSSMSGSVRRSQQYNPPQPQAGPQGTSSRTNGNLSPPPGSRGGGPPNRDYRLSAEIVVGAPPPGVTPSRPTSPRAPSPVMMVPAAPQPGSADVQTVLNNYEQSLPGERKSISRPASRNSYISPPAQSSQQNRRLSTDGYAGVGAPGRSVSPQPYMTQSRGASPQQVQPAGGSNRRNSYRAPVPGAISPGSHTSRQSSISVPQVSPHQQRPTSPNSVGIALGPDGRVVEDSMADRYKNQNQGQNQQYGHPGYRQIQQQPPPPTSQPPPPPHQTVQPVPPHLVQRTPSYPPPTQPPYGAPPPAPSYMSNYPQQPPPPGQPPQGHPSYIQQQQQRGPEPGQYGPPVHGGYQPQPVVNYGAPGPNGAPVPGGPPNAYMNYAQPPNGQVVHQPGQSQQIGGYPRAPSPARSPQPGQRQSNPQPPPTGQYTEDGRGVLFYGRCLSMHSLRHKMLT